MAKFKKGDKLLYQDMEPVVFEKYDKHPRVSIVKVHTGQLIKVYTESLGRK